MISIYGKRGETSRLLAEKLGARIYFRTMPRGGVIINWGYSCGKGLNAHIIGNKLKELEVLRDAGIAVPDFIRMGSKLESWAKGKYPILLRNLHHAQGRDIVIVKAERELDRETAGNKDFAIQYINKIAEFRAHVCGDKVVLVTKKVAIDSKADKMICNHGRGWKQCTYERGRDFYRKVADIAIPAIKAAHYDFGAVDIIIDNKGKAYVLELNAAPGLVVENRIDAYMSYFKEVENSYAS